MGHWLGDTFWASQIIPNLKEKYPESSIYVILRRNYSKIFRGLIEPENIIVASALVSDRKREKVRLFKLIASGLKLGSKHKFDWVLDLTGNRYSAIFGRCLQPRWFYGFNASPLGLLYDRKSIIDQSKLNHLREQPYKVLEPVVGKIAIPEIPRPPEAIYSKDEIFNKLDLSSAMPVAVIAPGGGWPEKRWSGYCFAELAKLLQKAGFQTVMTGSPAERYLCEGICASYGVKSKTLCSGDLDELTSLLSVSDIFIGHDSGPSHLAAAFGRRCIIIFPSTGPATLAEPKGSNVTVCDGREKHLSPEVIYLKIKN